MTIFSPKSAALLGLLLVMGLVMTGPAAALTFATESNEPSKKTAKSEGALQQSDSIKSFDIKIVGADLNALKQPPSYFDFSKTKFLQMPAPQSCWFEFKRRENKTKREELLARGNVDIRNSRLIFGSHLWLTKGMATPFYLEKEANLVVNSSGNIVGKTPFFLLFTNPGEVARAPDYVELGEQKKEKGGNNTPEGIYPFHVDSWAMGLLELSSCKDINA